MKDKITEAELREQVKILSAKFLQRTAVQIPQLQNELERLAATGDRDALRVIQNIVHKIHGSGAMFGFDLISDRAGDLEAFAHRISASADTTALAALAEPMRPLLEGLASALAAAERGGPPLS